LYWQLATDNWQLIRMEIKKGIGVSPGVVISTAVVLDAEDLLIPKRLIRQDEIEAEIERFNQAVAASLVELKQLRDDVSAKHGKELGGIFDFHLGILKDKSILTQIIAEIKNQPTTAEYAASSVTRRYAQSFAKMSDKYLSERVKDLYDIERRVLHKLVGQQHESLQHLQHNAVVIAHDLLPSQTAALDRMHVHGFATDVGGRTSHTAIVARAMGIPAVVGLGNITAEINGGDTVIIDGNRGVVIINPDEQQLAEHREYERKLDKLEGELAGLRDLPAQTKDGYTVSLMANIEFSEEVDEAMRRGASGVGLYRTEFLYLASPTEPTEEDHYHAYADALRRL
jgi:phosphotransferase system enzyme I (PtsI)